MTNQKSLPASATPARMTRVSVSGGPKALQAGVSTLVGIIIILAVAIIFFGGVFAYQYFFVKSQPVEQNNQQLIGGDKDAGGCLIAAGYSWCEAKQKCLRIWEEPCEETNTQTADWKTYTNTQYGFEFKYPNTLSLDETERKNNLPAVITLNKNNGMRPIVLFVMTEDEAVKNKSEISKRGCDVKISTKNYADTVSQVYDLNCPVVDAPEHSVDIYMPLGNIVLLYRGFYYEALDEGLIYEVISTLKFTN